MPRHWMMVQVSKTVAEKLTMLSTCCAQELKNSAEGAKSKAPRPLAALLGSKRAPDTGKARPDGITCTKQNMGTWMLQRMHPACIW